MFVTAGDKVMWFLLLSITVLYIDKEETNLHIYANKNETPNVLLSAKLETRLAHKR